LRHIVVKLTPTKAKKKLPVSVGVTTRCSGHKLTYEFEFQ